MASYTSLITAKSHAWHNGSGTITYSFLDRVPNYTATANYAQVDLDHNGTNDNWQIDATHYIPFTSDANVALNASQQQLMQLAISRWNEVANTHIVPFGGASGGAGTAGPVSGNGALVGNLGGPAGFGEQSPPVNDDGYQLYNFAQSGLFANGLNFYGHTYTSFYVNTNGSVSFGAGISQYTPTTISAGQTPMIAPYWADVDTRVGNPAYVDFDAVNHVITVTWANVGYYNQHTSPTNSFQLQLYDRGSGDFDIVFRYQSINWSSGDASGGSNGLGGTAARAGYTAGDGNNAHRAELSAAGNQAAMLALDSTAGNTGQTGLWVYGVRGGEVSVGDVTFGAYNWNTDPNTYGFAYIPTGAQHTPDRNGDLWLNLGNSNMPVAFPGDDGWDTYLHELGHSLGLDHPNGDPNDPTFTKLDTVMTYNHVAGQDYPITPMVMDIQAMQQLYGANLSTRTGDTTYFGAPVTGTTGAYAMDNGGLISGSSLHMIMTIWDAGGNDWVNASNQTAAVTIDLNPGGTSRIGTTYDNIRIAQLYTDPGNHNQYGWIENAIGGSGSDTLTGNAMANVLDGRAGNDTLKGGGGNDRFVFAPHYGADTVLDFVAGAHTDDRVDLNAFHLTLVAALSHASQSGADTLLNFGGGDVMTLKNVTKTALTADDFFGLQVPHEDFSGDSRSDILWQNSNGAISLWDNGQIGGAHVTVSAGTVDSSWHIAATANFDGNGIQDILWQNANGAVSIWDNGQIGTAHVIASAGALTPGWSIVNAGDFDGSGTDDILWQNTNGTVSVWNDGQIGGAHVIASAGALPAGWHIADNGDFDGNGTDDILWRNDNGAVSIWDNGQMAGAHIVASAGVIPTSWQVAGIGDFDGNGRDDILWRNDNGAVSIWDNGQVAGAHIIASAGLVPLDWHVAGTADYDGNGRSDILWRNDNGKVSIWDNGQIAAAHVIANAGVVSPDWHIV
ncbi:M10 family metallopeptidase C-terminal domain-containing protein [Bradyrhizobium tropiciagri]|uniref:nidogen-like domain-containing protein n=1 Tax=Bradyrhizobium tropiciagri TaxID=312253 RepID=UPI001BA6F0CA|nr:nidogen-like domain-containing protein [Bradyrhizobium tropiciagri]MBR0873901.1 M10 family metallopeptidase C-terminal domain-containing protein [Bradyrhizobium tropiciagri]